MTTSTWWGERAAQAKISRRSTLHPITLKCIMFVYGLMGRNFNVTHILDSRFHGNDRMGAYACHSRLDRESMVFFFTACLRLPLPTRVLRRRLARISRGCPPGLP